MPGTERTPRIYAVLIHDHPFILHQTKYANGNPRLELLTPDETQMLAHLTVDVPQFTTRAADADYAFKRVHGLFNPVPYWLSLLTDANLIKTTSDMIRTPAGTYAVVAQLLFV